MKPSFHASPKRLRALLVALILISLAGLAWTVLPRGKGPSNASFGWVNPALGAEGRKVSPTPTLTSTATQTPIPATATNTAVPIALPDHGAPEEGLRQQGVMILALRDGAYSHLFAYHPLYLPLTRLTHHPWDDMTPAISPDGTRLAYSSRQNGYWDLYLLDLATGAQARLTDTPEYESSPTWSPDGQWIAYERYNGVSLDIYIQSLTHPDQEPLQMTDDPGIDRAPAWSPQGREIAFVSTRSGSEEVWLARLDNIDDRFVNLSRSPLANNRYPAWSADGHYLAWASNLAGDRRIRVWDSEQPDLAAREIAEGDRVAWSPDNHTLFTETGDSNGAGLAGYQLDSGRLSLPLAPLPGAGYGMVWVKGPLPAWLEQQVHNPDTSPAPALWQPVLTRTVLPAGRMGLVEIPDVSAPETMLHDAVDEAFNTLRKQVAAETGWDALSSLENAYLALTSPSLPAAQNDWLYTGRAFSLNPLLLSAGWMTVVREDYHGQTYWRVYLKARYQDGSMGLPLTALPWDLNARYGSDPRAYELGGRPGAAPAGFWIDLTEITQRYGWERLPSLTNWRTFYPSIRYNQFVMTGGLSWNQAMAELYPPEALVTATPLPSATPTLTPTARFTPRFTPTRVTATPSPTLTPIATRRPTWTPLPAQPGP